MSDTVSKVLPHTEEEVNTPSDPPLPSDASAIDDSRISGDGTDDDGGEKPVREKLKQTSIDTLSQVESAQHTSIASGSHQPEGTSIQSQPERGRPVRKRSFDDVQSEDATSNGGGSAQNVESNHKRMRSREGTNGETLPELTSDETAAAAQELGEIMEAPVPPVEKDPISRPATPPPDHTAPQELASSTILSPQKKRTHDEVDREVGRKSDHSDESYVHVKSDEHMSDNGAIAQDKDEPEKKRTRDLSQSRKKETSLERQDQKKFGFSNTSSVSPFGAALTSKDNDTKPTEEAKEVGTTDKPSSTSAFASSGISAFARSESSPFGALAATSKPSGFGSGPSVTNGRMGFGFGTSAAAPSPFASAASSGIAGLSSSSSGFGGSGLGSGFASATGFGGAKPIGSGLGGFASASSTTGIIGASSGQTKAFGAPANEEDEEDEEGSGNEDPEAAEDKSKEKRFVGQEIETGEENEETLFSCKAKLFHFDKEWKERGIGTFKLNVNEEFEFGGEHEKKARFIMRTEGVHRVVLNTPVFKGMKVGSNDGKEPAGKMLNLSSVENGKFVPLLLKTGSLDLARDLYRKVKSVQESLQS